VRPSPPEVITYIAL